MTSESATTERFTADAWWSLWLDLSARTGRLGDAVVAKGEEHQDATDPEVKQRLWEQYEDLSRLWDIARARQEVAMARYLVAKHGLATGDVFDVCP